MFSLGGEAFWVDLRQGLVHCDWPPSSAGGGSSVDFGFIPLPLGCPPDLRYTQPTLQESDFAEATIDRTSALVNGTIRFVYIDRARPGGNVIVCVSDLDLETKVWKNCKTFLAKELWRLWSFKEGLPETEPRFPVLMADGTLCLLLCNKPKKGYADPTDEDYICNVELSNLTVLWSARLRKHHTIDAPPILPTHFFRALNALDPQKRELRGVFTQKQ
ncbi:hypothetical protein U9M48_010757 [Paspalum notatum var. saurae]|uniref:DUF1618 domain-containing protein n=1 Tax=Paspalum notatum var. saurae TaxID=547442 RepID=A0AAQ3WGM7_PASNO